MNESNFNRRDFLKSACIGVGALSLSGCVDTDKSKSADGGNEGGLPSVDVLVIGSGGAGLRAAVAVRKSNPNLSVVVATKMMPSRNATYQRRYEFQWRRFIQASCLRHRKGRRISRRSGCRD